MDGDQSSSSAASKGRPVGRSLADFRLKDAITPNGLLPAEELLLSAVKDVRYHQDFKLGDNRPFHPADDKRIRGDFIRFLALGGDENAPVHERGVRIKGALIEGDLDFEDCDGVRPLGLWNCWITGLVILRDARTKGILLSGSRVQRILAGNARVDGNIFFKDGFLADGPVGFPGAQINGDLDCRGGVFNNPSDWALDCDRATIKGAVFLSDNFSSKGRVSFFGADISGQLNCNGSTFENTHGIALNFENAKFNGGVFLRDGFSALGKVSFLSAEVRGDFDCDGGSFKSPDTALDCDLIKISGMVTLRSKFTAQGAVRFFGARIGGDFACSGGHFLNPKARRQPNLPEGVRVEDCLDLYGAKIGGTLTLGPAGPVYEEVTFVGDVDLQSAQAQAFIDSADSWPTNTAKTDQGELPCCLILDGFTYERFARTAPTDYKIRQDWLLRQRKSHLDASFRPQPFEQLITVLRAMGHDADARRIGFFKQKLLRPIRTKQARWYYKPFVWMTGWAFGLTCGYGYRPHRLFLALVVLWLSCAGIYHLAAQKGVFAPADAQVWTNETLAKACYAGWTSCKASVCKQEVDGKPALQCDAVADLVAFNALTFSADVLLPVIDLKQRSTWTPMLRSFDVEIGTGRTVHFPRWFVRGTTWTQNILGPLGAILIGAILSGLVKRD